MERSGEPYLRRTRLGCTPFPDHDPGWWRPDCLNPRHIDWVIVFPQLSNVWPNGTAPHCAGSIELNYSSATVSRRVAEEAVLSTATAITCEACSAASAMHELEHGLDQNQSPQSASGAFPWIPPCPDASLAFFVSDASKVRAFVLF